MKHPVENAISSIAGKGNPLLLSSHCRLLLLVISFLFGRCGLAEDQHVLSGRLDAMIESRKWDQIKTVQDIHTYSTDYHDLATLSQLSKLPKLENLSLSGLPRKVRPDLSLNSPFTRTMAARVPKTVERLSLSSFRLAGSTLSELTQGESLEELLIERCVLLEPTSFVISQNDSIWKLELPAGIPSERYGELTKLTSLKSLQLSDSPTNDELRQLVSLLPDVRIVTTRWVPGKSVQDYVQNILPSMSGDQELIVVLLKQLKRKLSTIRENYQTGDKLERLEVYVANGTSQFSRPMIVGKSNLRTRAEFYQFKTTFERQAKQDYANSVSYEAKIQSRIDSIEDSAPIKAHLTRRLKSLADDRAVYQKYFQ